MSDRQTSSERTDLQPMPPEKAADLWEQSKVDEWAEATRKLQTRHVAQFVDWLDGENITDVRDVTARAVYEFRLSITDDLAQSTVAQRISTVQRFLKFCVSVDAVDPSVPERVELPKRDVDPRAEMLEEGHASDALDHLQRFKYASREHALLAVCWHSGLRTGTLRSLDLDDVDAENERLRLRHRPETGTPLKNGVDAERYVALSADVTRVVVDYIDHKRIDVRDEHGRRPLFTTENGRAAVKTLRRWFEESTRPCNWTECPHGRDPSDCAAAQRQREARDCPSTVTGHPVRRGAITRHLREDVPETVVSDRCNVSPDVLDEHYDRRSEDEKAEQRREYLDGL